MNKNSRKVCTVNMGRWMSYAAAGAATAFAASNDADAGILYSGVLNINMSAPPTFAYTYLKTMHANGVFGTHKIGYISHEKEVFPPGSGVAFLANFVMTSANAKAVGTNVGTRHYASKLALGANLLAGPFEGGINKMADFRGTSSGGGAPGSITGNRKWSANGTGFLGFEFNTGAGEEYGWARVTMSGGYMHNMTLVDYAYGTPGQAITAGQVPEPASLGLLALGAAGLLAARLNGRRKAA